MTKWAQDLVKTLCQVMAVEHTITWDGDDENQVCCVFSWALDMEGAKMHSLF